MLLLMSWVVSLNGHIRGDGVTRVDIDDMQYVAWKLITFPSVLLITFPTCRVVNQGQLSLN